MSDKIKGFTVELSVDIKDEDFDQIENAIKMIKGVGSIKRSICDSDDWINRCRIRNEIMTTIYNIVDKEK